MTKENQELDLEQLIQTRKLLRELFLEISKELDLALYRAERSLRMTVAKWKDGARRELKEIRPMIDDAFTVDSPKKLAQMAQIYGEDLAAALYETQLRIEGLRGSVIQIAAPLAQAVVPLVNTAVQALTTLTTAVGKAVAAFFEGAFGIKAYDSSLKGVIATTSKMERQLAGFDQINRLGSSQSSGLTSALLPDSKLILPGWENLAEKIQKLLEPLKKINFQPAIEAAREALEALKPVLDAVLEALEWAWYNLLVPMAQWAAENVLPAFLQTLTTVFETLGQILEDIRPTLTWLWEHWLQNLAQWYGEKIIRDIQGMGEQFKELGNSIKENIPGIQTLLGGFDGLLGIGRELFSNFTIWDGALDGLIPTVLHLGSAIGLMPNPLGDVLALVGSMTPALTDAAGGWDTLKDSAVGSINAMGEAMANGDKDTKNFLNGILGSFETSIGYIGSAFNSLFGKVSGNLGITGAALQFPTIVTPRIPRLAQGAVLPANKPFMAVVGDQTHGTNVEAPLATIEKALDLALADRLEGVMAGFQAVTSRQEQLLEAVLGLDLSDGALAGAVERYERRMAFATGGV